MKLLAAFTALLFCLLPPAAAAEEPETAYGNFHRAILDGNAEALMRYVPNAQRPDLARLTPEQKAAQLKIMGAVMPRTFLLRKKTLDTSRQGADLVVSGPGKVVVGGKPAVLYGLVRMALESGEWKVADVSWSTTEPEGGLQAESRAVPLKPAAPAEKSVQTPARAANAPPVVGSMDSAPARKLGQQKPPCEFKPVMTAEDLENCK